MIKILLICMTISMISAQAVAIQERTDQYFVGQEYFSAHDYTQAMALYKSQLNASLTPWQSSRLFYNLGTIALAQNNPEDALNYFKQVSPEKLPLPELISHLYVNIASAYLVIAEALPPTEREKEQFLIEMAIIALKEAQDVICTDNKVNPCAPSRLIRTNDELAQKLLKQNRQKSLEEARQKSAQPQPEETAEQTSNRPIAILQQAVDHSKKTLQLTFQYQLNAAKGTENQEALSSLIQQQKEIHNLVEPFIPAVIEQEKTSYQQKDKPDEQCQQSPWDKVIPLYDEGWRNTLEVEALFSKTPLQVAPLIAAQEAAIRAWNQALTLLSSPPHKEPIEQTNKKLNETFRLIQEMYMEDQSEPAPLLSERHAW